MFLISDPYPAAAAVLPDAFHITGLPTPVDSPAQVNPDGTVQLHFDLTGTPDGTYSVTVTATQGSGPASAPSAPLSFTLPIPTGAPDAPANIRLSAV